MEGKILRPMKIFSGNSNVGLAQEICSHAKVELGKALVGRFSDGEVNVRIEDGVRGCDVFVCQSLCPPVNDNIMELLIMIDALRRASATRITTVIPYFGYARQDRKAEPRVPITAKLIANLLSIAGSQRILVMDLHVGQIQGFFDIPVDHLHAEPVLSKYFLDKKIEDLIVVSPDVGGVERARNFAKRLNANLAIIDKRRPKANEADIMNIIGEVKDKNCIIFDDLADTAGTLCKVASALKKEGSKKVWAACSHGVLSGKAIENLRNAPIDEFVMTNTIVLSKEKMLDKIKILSVGELFGEAIKRIHLDESVSVLFK
jgi:ribose-phosphate pyrophosphokinase